ncbi:hypothetical protein AAG906_026407 [Vitis piasezkii]
MSTACIIDSRHDRRCSLHHAIQDLIDLAGPNTDLDVDGTVGIWYFGIFQVEDLVQSTWIHHYAAVHFRAHFHPDYGHHQSRFRFVESSLHDDRWIVMREWLDCLMMLLRQMDRHGASRFESLHMTSEKLSHDFRGVAMTMLDGCQSLVLAM